MRGSSTRLWRSRNKTGILIEKVIGSNGNWRGKVPEDLEKNGLLSKEQSYANG